MQLCKFVCGGPPRNAGISDLRRYNERTPINTCINKSIFQALESHQVSCSESPPTMKQQLNSLESYHRAVAIRFEVVRLCRCVRKHTTARGFWGQAPPEHFYFRNLEAMRLLLRPFWGQNDAYWKPDDRFLQHAGLLTLRHSSTSFGFPVIYLLSRARQGLRD